MNPDTKNAKTASTGSQQHPVVFDTMIDERRISRQNTGDRPNQNQQYLIHSLKPPPPASWATNVKSFLNAPRKQENDDDAVYWCE
ncbi:unnamed protein product [Pseudo-nitzschia multistriata]|uniref:Uncharacterized protein n=1 Tax=Pseudo-nitzschia multistriata TaxID=183589 RepID=A0A448ZK91_9STRA|nr:unnamed protein product [Pseudo-nitzschia multistriata]